MSTRLALACGTMAVAVLAATAGDQWSGHPAQIPMTAGSGLTTIVRSVAVGPTQEPITPGCNPRASLRPQGSLPAPGQMPAGSTMDRIAKQGHLVTGILEDTYPFAFRDLNLRLEGFDIDIARDIAGAIFGDREAVVFRPLREAARLEALNAHQVDLVVATETINCKRQELVDFSTVYYEAAQRVLVKRGSGAAGLDDLGGKRVCSARGATSLTKILAAPSKPITVGANTQTDCLMLLQLGSVDAISTDDTILAGMVTQDARTEIVGPRLTEELYGVAINKGAPDLVRFVNAEAYRKLSLKK
jgi:polar amino acid transport system substrate-binding protein